MAGMTNNAMCKVFEPDMRERVRQLDTQRQRLERMARQVSAVKMERAKLDFVGMCGRFLWEIKRLPASTIRSKYAKQIRNMLKTAMYDYCLGN